MFTELKQYFLGLTNIFYPHLCAVCGNVLYLNERAICLRCYADLPLTGFHDLADNDVSRLFWGRVPVRNATSFMVFNKDSRYRKILHELKYNQQPAVGTEMGRLFGLELRDTPFADVQLLLPVPLHPGKLRQRGYNQSELIAKGMAEILHKPVRTDLLARRIMTGTQTRKSRYQRWENVREAFQVKLQDEITDNHVLLVDDVITTGATMESCAEALLKIPGVTVSIASLAFTKLQP